jgi:hypothetical protein
MHVCGRRPDEVPFFFLIFLDFGLDWDICRDRYTWEGRLVVVLIMIGGIFYCGG